jgi:predicted O-methyltransferase YrrM
MKFLRILFFLFKKKNFLILFKKFLNKFEKDNSKQALEWAKIKTRYSMDEWMSKIDYKLYLETKKVSKKIKLDAKKILNANPFWSNLLKKNMSGPASYELLYFLTKKKKPNIIVETGIAAGWSSLAFLRASKNNDNVKIYSSDFPYFREKNSKKNIGILMQNEINLNKVNLFIEGDEVNIPLIIKKLGNNKIDLFHYDSDKSYSGRKFCLNMLRSNFSRNAVLIFDDIHNNFHFRDFVENNKLKYQVFEHVGMVDFSCQ